MGIVATKGRLADESPTMIRYWPGSSTHAWSVVSQTEKDCGPRGC
ncbi:MAG: hypothetical protein ABSF33_20100 [Acidimicrobiales bacterium]